MFRLKYLFN